MSGRGRERKRQAGRKEPRGQYLSLGVTCSPALHSLLRALLCRNPRPQLQGPPSLPGPQHWGLAGILLLHAWPPDPLHKAQLKCHLFCGTTSQFSPVPFPVPAKIHCSFLYIYTENTEKEQTAKHKSMSWS